MDVFVGNLSNRVDVVALETVFQKFCKAAHVKFFKYQNHGAKMRYACISADPSKQAQRAMKQLDNTTFDGETLIVREYHHRASFNERRTISWRKVAWTKLEKRTHDRRGYLAENFTSGVRLVEMRVLDQSQAAPHAKGKKTPRLVQVASQGHRV